MLRSPIDTHDHSLFHHPEFQFDTYDFSNSLQYRVDALCKQIDELFVHKDESSPPITLQDRARSIVSWWKQTRELLNLWAPQGDTLKFRLASAWAQKSFLPLIQDYLTPEQHQKLLQSVLHRHTNILETYAAFSVRLGGNPQFEALSKEMQAAYYGTGKEIGIVDVYNRIIVDGLLKTR